MKPELRGRTLVIVFLVAWLIVGWLEGTAGAHSAEEQSEWYAAWAERVVATGITPELIAEWRDFTERHERHKVAPVRPERTSRVSAPTGSYTAASGEPWRGLVAAYFPASAVNTMTCLVGYESAGNPSARNPRSGASGLLQVMPFWADHFGVSRSALFDPDTNVRIARKVWDAQGFGAWSPWNRGECRP